MIYGLTPAFLTQLYSDETLFNRAIGNRVYVAIEGVFYETENCIWRRATNKFSINFPICNRFFEWQVEAKDATMKLYSIKTRSWKTIFVVFKAINEAGVERREISLNGKKNFVNIQ